MSRGPVCYRTKANAVKAFADANRHIIDAFGGLHNRGSGGEFDAVNERYGLRGKKKVNTLAKAIAAAFPPGRPFCLDQVDLEVLNDTGPARAVGAEFQLPYAVEEALAAKRYEDYYAQFAGTNTIGCPAAKSFRRWVNMSPKAIRRWARDPRAKEASFAATRRRLPALAKLRSKPAGRWTASDCKFAARVVNFNTRMSGVVRKHGCTRKAVISLRNWGHQPSRCPIPK